MKNKLWTKNFTILILGSVVSMLGNALSGFAISLLVLDYTGSAASYSIYIIAWTLPQIVMPIFSGAVLDRFSRRKTIYTLDFLSGLIYLGASFVLGSGWFNFSIFIVVVFVIGLINSMYMVAYQSFFPMLVSEGNYQKAYSVSSFLEMLIAAAVPVSAFMYNSIGVAPLLRVNSLFFFTAAIAETFIRAEEKYIATQKENRTESRYGKQFLADIKEGFAYLIGEKGLLAVAIYFTFSAFEGGAEQVVMLPYFKLNMNNLFHLQVFGWDISQGEYLYMIVGFGAIFGRAFGGMYHYRKNLPVEKKFDIALFVYIITGIFAGVLLFVPIKFMVILMFLSGICGITSYTIRISATQHYVPDERKGRFNGAFNMLNTFGTLVGELTAGLLTKFVDERFVIAGINAITIIAAIVFIGGRRKDIAPIYNTQN